MKIENEFIPYEQVLALKNLGFDEPCLDFYDNNAELFYNHENKEKIHIGDSVKAPLYQQAFRWFREKHNLYHFVSNERNGNRFNASIYTRSFNGWSIEMYVRTPKDYSQYDTFDSPEEAELECLKKLIEIVKFKKK